MAAISVSVPSTERIQFSELDAKMAKLWAIDQGYPVPPRGRVSGDTLLAWHWADRPHYEVQEKFSIPRGERAVFSAWAQANGHDTDAKGYALWEATGKAEPEGYLSADTLAVVDYEDAEGTVHSVPVLKERMDAVRGPARGRPASREYLQAAGLPDDATPVRMVTKGGAVHKIEQDDEGDFVIRWETKRDGAEQYREQITQARNENERLASELSSARADNEALVELVDAKTELVAQLEARIAELEAAAVKPAPRKRTPRKAAAKPAE